jgi:integrase
MAIKKVKTGWQLDMRPEGRYGKRIQRTFPTKREAMQFEVAQKALANAGEWKPPVKDNRRLLDLVDDWFKLYGHTLKDGKGRKGILEGSCTRLENPLGRNFTGEDWLLYRNDRLQMESYRKKQVTPNAVNHEHAYLSAMFGTLIKLKNWPHTNPLKGIPKIPMDEPELIYLELSQIAHLLDHLAESRNPDVLIITKICLSTGARWSEAEKLEGQRIKQGLIHFVKTKNSKARAVPISKAFEKEIFKGRPRIGRLFPRSAYDAFVAAVERAKITLPDGQMTHVLRHSFASHFMINDGNILKLKDILGHKTLAMTIRYAKLAPGHLTQAIEKNPITTLESPQSLHTKEPSHS